MEKLGQEEQDRIFNELVISGLVLALLFYDTVLENPNSNIEFFSELKIEMFSAYSSILVELGAKKDDADLFKKVILMRLKECQKDYEENKAELPSKKTLAWPLIVAIGCYDHVTRGEGHPADHAFKITAKWLSDLFLIILKIK